MIFLFKLFSFSYISEFWAREIQREIIQRFWICLCGHFVLCSSKYRSFGIFCFMHECRWKLNMNLLEYFGIFWLIWSSLTENFVQCQSYFCNEIYFQLVYPQICMPDLTNFHVIFRYYNNACYAKVGGISTIEMNFLEVDFLFGLNFNLNVTPSTFTTYFSYLQREMFLLQPPLDSADSSLSLGKSLKLNLCFDEGETSHQQQQLAV